MVVVREVLCKSVLSPCRISDIPYSVNPYVGCQHGCAYCYARFMLKYHLHPEPWGSFVDAKINAPRILAEQLRRVKPRLVLLSSVTDPYQPVEARLHLTRRCLEQLLDFSFPVTILTKSSLVTRDIDLFQEFTSCEVGLTITTLDESVRRSFEPSASRVEERLRALETLNASGVPTYAFLGPILPILSEASFEALVEKLRDVGVGRVLVDRLNIKAGNWATIRDVLEKHYRSLLPEFQRALFVDKEYYSRLKERIGEILERVELEYSFCY